MRLFRKTNVFALYDHNLYLLFYSNSYDINLPFLPGVVAGETISSPVGTITLDDVLVFAIT